MVLRTDTNKTIEQEAKLLTNWDSNYWWHTNGVNRSGARHEWGRLCVRTPVRSSQRHLMLLR